MIDQYIILDNIKWWVSTNLNGTRNTQPLCPIHGLRLRPVQDYYSRVYNYSLESHTLKCEECKGSYVLPRSYQREQIYVLDKLDSPIFKSQKFINFDDEAIPIAEDKAKSKDKKYFVTARLIESKVGVRLVVFAGERGSNQKTEIFVEPDIKRLAFDQNDLHPTDVFTELEATFIDGSKHRIEKTKGGDD